jgi:hypothetical protein
MFNIILTFEGRKGADFHKEKQKEWRIENGELRIENGEWRMENGENGAT